MYVPCVLLPGSVVDLIQGHGLGQWRHHPANAFEGEFRRHDTNVVPVHFKVHLLFGLDTKPLPDLCRKGHLAALSKRCVVMLHCVTLSVSNHFTDSLTITDYCHLVSTPG